MAAAGTRLRAGQASSFVEQLEYGRWYSGAGLSELLGVSRAMVNKRVAKAVDAGELDWRLEPREGRVGRSRVLYRRRCRHHWRIARPDGEKSQAKCGRCGAEREFKNFNPRYHEDPVKRTRQRRSC